MRHPAIILALTLIVALSACAAETPTGSETAPPTSAAGECPRVAEGEVSQAITAEGDVGSKPTVSIDSPVAVTKSERTVSTEGTGTIAGEGFNVTVEYTIFNGTTGEEVDATAYAGDGVALVLDETLVPGLLNVLLCSAEGSRVIGVLAPGDGLNEASLTQLGLSAEDALVAVLDVVSVSAPAEVIPPLPRADGVDQELPAGFPAITVTLGEDGAPTLTLPNGEPPATLQLAVVKKGTGAVVQPGSDVIVHYQGVNWTSKEIFDESWPSGNPAKFNTAQVIPGFTQALEGQTVGSQVLVVIPPDLGYGPSGGQPAAGISATDTLVFVIDILGIG